MSSSNGFFGNLHPLLYLIIECWETFFGCVSRQGAFQKACHRSVTLQLQLLYTIMEYYDVGKNIFSEIFDVIKEFYPKSRWFSPHF